MKTKNNVQKTILKSLTVVASLVLISITANAQDNWKSQFESYNNSETELAMVDNNNVTISGETDADVFSSFLEQETEKVLELENWMKDESYFGVSTFQIMEETDAELELEDWMLNENLFNTTNEAEQPLELEDWMTSEETWRG